MDIVSLITRITVALEKLADAQLLIATGDGPVPADRTRAPQEATTPPVSDGPAADTPEEAPALPEREIGPVEVREALTAVIRQPDGKKRAAAVLATFKGHDGKPVKKVSQIPAESLGDVHAELMKEVE